MFQIAINKPFKSLFARVLASQLAGSIPGQDMTVSGPLIEDGDDLCRVSL